MLKIQSSKTALLTLTRSRRWSDRMVYILTANKHLRYRDKGVKDRGAI